MARTTNKYWLFLEQLRRSGVTNMYGAVPHLVTAFDELSYDKAKDILADWMRNYNRDDYKEDGDEVF